MNAPAKVTLQSLKAQPAEFSAPAVFNPDAWHAMQARDDQLIQDSILHGAARTEYVYEFSISNTKVRGVSVIGARELASQYGGIKSRIVASVDKTGDLFVFKSFEPLAIQANIIPQLLDQEDFYEVVVEIQDLKTGNSIQVRKKETKVERKRDGTPYDRPHYDVIAESKAFRNGVLSILPQGVIKGFMERCLKGSNASQEKTIDQLREGALAFAAKAAIGLDRKQVEQLTYAQILGLGNAAREGLDAFKGAALSLGVVVGQQIAAVNDQGGVDNDRRETDGEITRERTGDATEVEQERTGNPPAGEGPTIEDAIAHIKRGEYAEARDIARGIDQVETVEGMIKSHQNRQPSEQPASRRGNRGQRSVE